MPEVGTTFFTIQSARVDVQTCIHCTIFLDTQGLVAKHRDLTFARHTVIHVCVTASLFSFCFCRWCSASAARNWDSHATYLPARHPDQ